VAFLIGSLRSVPLRPALAFTAMFFLAAELDYCATILHALGKVKAFGEELCIAYQVDGN
jgi:hypothetical protein